MNVKVPSDLLREYAVRYKATFSFENQVGKLMFNKSGISFEITVFDDVLEWYVGNSWVKALL